MRSLIPDELAALADGTLAAERRAALLSLVSTSPMLAWQLELQMTAIKVLRGLDVSAPPEVRERIERAILGHEKPDQGCHVT